MLRIISVVLMLSIILIVSAIPIAAETEALDPLNPPENSVPVTGTDFFMWYLNSATGHTAPDLEYYQFTTTLSLDSLQSTNYVWVYPFANLEMSNGEDAVIEKGNTYVLRVEFNQGPFGTSWNTMSNFNPRLSTGSDMPLHATYDLGEYVTDNSISVSIVQSNNVFNMTVIFHLSDDTPLPCRYVAPFLRFTGGSIAYLRYASLTGYIDPDLSIFEKLISGQLEDITAAIDAAANQAHQDSLIEQNLLNQIQAGINGGSEEDADREAAEELGDLEGSIMDNVSNVTLPDGTVVSASSNVFSRLDQWITANYSPVEFNSNAATILDEILDVFMPYLGIVILLNLSLALGISFLSGRRAGT